MYIFKTLAITCFFSKNYIIFLSKFKKQKPSLILFKFDHPFNFSPQGRTKRKKKGFCSSSSSPFFLLYSVCHFCRCCHLRRHCRRRQLRPCHLGHHIINLIFLEAGAAAGVASAEIAAGVASAEIAAGIAAAETAAGEEATADYREGFSPLGGGDFETPFTIGISGRLGAGTFKAPYSTCGCEICNEEIDKMMKMMFSFKETLNTILSKRCVILSSRMVSLYTPICE